MRGGNALIERRNTSALDPFKAQILQYVGIGKWEFEVAAHMKTIGMADLMKNGLNYRKALIILGFAVDGRGKVTMPGHVPIAHPIPVHILPAAGPVVAPRMRIHIKRAPRDDERPSMMP
jgi:hypothetical protein